MAQTNAQNDSSEDIVESEWKALTMINQFA
jgi:hypothetical protein